MRIKFRRGPLPTVARGGRCDGLNQRGLTMDRVVLQDVRSAADDIAAIARAMRDLLLKRAASHRDDSEMILLASAAELAWDKAVMISDGCRPDR